jgi:hypothetical protein
MFLMRLIALFLLGEFLIGVIGFSFSVDSRSCCRRIVRYF